MSSSEEETKLYSRILESGNVESSSTRSFAKSSRPLGSLQISPKNNNSNSTAIAASSKADDNVFTSAKSTLYVSVFVPAQMAETRVLYTPAVFGRSVNTDTFTDGPANTPELRGLSTRKATTDATTGFAEAYGTSANSTIITSPIPPSARDSTSRSNPTPPGTRDSTSKSTPIPPSIRASTSESTSNPPSTRDSTSNISVNPTSKSYPGKSTPHSDAVPTSHVYTNPTTHSITTTLANDVIPTAFNTTPSRKRWTMPSYRETYDDINVTQLRRERLNRSLAVRKSCSEFSTAIENDLHHASPSDRSSALTILITYVQSLAALLYYADVLFVTVREWPHCYPLETEGLYNIFAADLVSTPTEAFEGPTVVAFFEDMHEDFVRDWVLEVQGLHDRLNVLADGVADARTSLFIQATNSLSSAVDGCGTAFRDSSRRRVTIALDDARSDDSSEQNEQYESGEEMGLSGGVNEDHTMDTTKLLHSLPVLALSRPTSSGVTPRPPFYGRQSVNSVTMSLRAAARGSFEPNVQNNRVTSWSRREEEQDLKNRDALMCAREESLRLREEMMVTRESHAREVLLLSKRRETRVLESCLEIT